MTEAIETLIVYPVEGSQALSLSDVEKLLSVIDAREALVMHGITRHPRAPMLLRLLSACARRVSIIVSTSEVSEAVKLVATVPEPNIELVVYSSPSLIEAGLLHSLRLAYEHGCEMISVYYTFKTIEELRRSLRLVGSLEGLPVCYRIGAPLYEEYKPIHVVGEPGVRIALPYGVLYGYRARRAYIGQSMATILERPCPRNCRKLTIRPSKIMKCPFNPLKTVPISNISEEEAYHIARYPCTKPPALQQESISVKVVVECNGVPIPEDIVQLLIAVNEVGSIRAACKLLGLSAPQVVEKLHRLEKRIGAKLVESRRGGQGGGCTVLTRLGEEVIRRYLTARRSLEFLG